MTLYAENDTEDRLSLDAEELARRVGEAVLEEENCPFEASVNLLITDDRGIREYNREYRKIDRETDVLSFPNLDFSEPGNFERVQENRADYFDPDTGELLLGDIVLSAEKVREQAQSYGHSIRREFAFLVAHSMLHLCGYDHMEDGDRIVMEDKQEKILRELGITRED